MAHFAERTVLALLLSLLAAHAPAQEAGERWVIPVSVIYREGKAEEPDASLISWRSTTLECRG